MHSHGVVLMFNRAARCNADLNESELLSRVRSTAIAKGCNQAKKAMVEAYAKDLLATGFYTPNKIIDRAREYAIRLANNHGPHGPRAA